MSYALQVFVSSTCYDLRDLRAGIRSWLDRLGMTPLLSDQDGFPHVDGMPPYATCLRTLEECPLIIGVIDRRYGTPFEDWGPYGQFAGCAPTHAELRHALDLGKRALIYVHDDVWNFFEVWRRDPQVFSMASPRGLDEATLHMLQELKQRAPVPWMARFSDVADLIHSLNAEFVNQLYGHLRDRERQTADMAGYILEKVVEAAPEVQERITAGLAPDLVIDRDALRDRLMRIENELERERGASLGLIADLEVEKSYTQSRLDAVSRQLNQASLMLARAAMRDASWLSSVRTTMMPKQPGRVPFHNTAEVALRGYHSGSGNHQVPILTEVTWAPLDYLEAGLHRGYRAGIILRGGNFVPGITTTCRRRGEGPPAGNADYFWRLPSIYFGDYLEISASDNAPEAALSWRGYEFQVKNPDGARSEWIGLSYPFDDVTLNGIRLTALTEGGRLLADGQPAQAIEPLRKAWVFADRMLGIDDTETQAAKVLWEKAREAAALARLRFRPGDDLKLRQGLNAGRRGIVERLMLNHLHAYVIRPTSDQGEPFMASDVEVELAADQAS